MPAVRGVVRGFLTGSMATFLPVLRKFADLEAEHGNAAKLFRRQWGTGSDVKGYVGMPSAAGMLDAQPVEGDRLDVGDELVPGGIDPLADQHGVR